MFTVTSQPWSLLKWNCELWVPWNISNQICWILCSNFFFFKIHEVFQNKVQAYSTPLSKTEGKCFILHLQMYLNWGGSNTLLQIATGYSIVLRYLWYSCCSPIQFSLDVLNVASLFKFKYYFNGLRYEELTLDKLVLKNKLVL